MADGKIGEFFLSCIRETNLSREFPNRALVGPQNELWGVQKAIETGLQILDELTKQAQKAVEWSRR